MIDPQIQEELKQKLLEEKERIEKEKLQQQLKNLIQCPKCHHKFSMDKKAWKYSNDIAVETRNFRMLYRKHRNNQENLLKFFDLIPCKKDLQPHPASDAPLLLLSFGKGPRHQHRVPLPLYEW